MLLSSRLQAATRYTGTAWMVSAMLFSIPGAATPREELSLNGSWQTIKVPSLDTPLPQKGWNEIEVPGFLEGHNYERAWFRRSFSAPDSWEGMQIFLRFGGVKFRSRVLVNGENIGGCFNGYDAFDLDVTEAIRFGEPNELLVGVHDWTGLFTGEQVSFGGRKDWTALREIPRDHIVSPIGGRFDLYGIWDDVNLSAVAPTYIRGCSIRSSTREQRLAIEFTVVNKEAADFHGTVQARIYPYDGSPRDTSGTWPVAGSPLAVSEAQPIVLRSGQEKTATIELRDPPLRAWWPHDPQLYVVELHLVGNSEDCLRERIGFRKFWIEGGDFYLNGAKIHLLARSWWPAETPLSREAIADQISMLKAMNVNCFRTHTQPWPRRWYEAADELGLLMIPEGAVFNDDEVYRVHDSRFWDAYAQHLQAMVRHLRNHPSIIMWSLENEFHGVRARDGTAVETELARMGHIVKQLDPTRPILYESDGDPGGAADVVGLHYPNEYPERRLWPNDAYWMDQPNASRTNHMFWDAPHFLWDRSKPLYIGEFLWVPDKAPSTATLFFGDEVYTAPTEYHYRAKAEAWRMQILAYRHYGVSGFAPWGYDFIKPEGPRQVVLLAQRDMFRPLAAFVRERDSRFFAGEQVKRTIELFNDTASDHPEAHLAWRIFREHRVAGRGDLTVNLPAGAHEEADLLIPMPEVVERSSFTLALRLDSYGKEQFYEEWPIDVFPRYDQWSLPDTSLFLYDPEGKLRTAWEEAGVAFHTLETIEAWPGDGVLIIGPRIPVKKEGPKASTPVLGPMAQQLTALREKVRAGGKVLALAQAHETTDFLPVQLTALSSTMAFIQMPNHPVLHTFQPGDFRWWRGDHRVTHREPARPLRGARPLIVTGTEQGISHAPLLELPEGEGVWLLCQLLVVDKLNSEPVAQRLIEEMVQYLAGYQRPHGRTVCRGSRQLRDQLDQLRVKYSVLDDWSSLRWPKVQLLILQADDETLSGHIAALTRFLERGGTVLLHRPQREEFAQLRPALNLPVTMEPYRGAVVRAEEGSPLAEELTREDLHWLDEPIVRGTADTARTSHMADAVFVRPLDPDRGPSFEAEDNVALDGPFVMITNGEVVFGSEGSAIWQITIPETGSYTLGVLARGTPCEGVYPLADVTVDGRLVGIFEASRIMPDIFTVELHEEQGDHALSVAFVNDARNGAEDRNLYVDKFILARHPEQDRVETITRPAALVRIPIGDGHLVLNAIRWDDANANKTKAHRFASSLLLALGAEFREIQPVIILEAEALEPNPGIAAFYPAEDHVLLAANGYLQQKVHIATAGRYQLVFWAKGTPVAGAYPIVAVQLDGRELGRVECVGESWRPHELVVALPAGEATLRFAFINDQRQPPEDRNLWLDRIEFVHVREPN